LRSYTSGGNWGETDFLRAAFLSQAWSRLGDSFVADSVWQTAVGKAGGRFGALTALLDLSRRWQMNESAVDDLLWRIVQNFPRERWAQQDLERRYFVVGNTAKLKQLFARELAFSPEDISLKNNLAATMLLLNDNLPQAFQLASDAYARRPEDPVVVSTYAYALHLQGRTRDGIAALEKLKPESLAEPSVALYYGVLLAAQHDTNRAASFLAIAQANGQLLPEEKKLLAAAGNSDPIQ
jgi:Flp pilus assembly protein TadD